MRMTQPTITKLTFERNACSLGIGQPRPKISWRFAQESSTVKDFKQKTYELRFERDGSTNTYKVDSGDNVEVPWPEKEKDLASRERVKVGVRAAGGDGGWTQWLDSEVEAGLFKDGDWKAEMITSDITPPLSMTKRPIYLRSSFKLADKDLQSFDKRPPRIYATAFGVYSIFINGHQIGDHVLAPGWQAYQHLLHYQTYDIPPDVLHAGENVIGIIVGEGWYAGRLTWNEGCRNYWGQEIGARCQLELGGQTISTNTKDWTWTHGPLISSELYDGEYFDAALIDAKWAKTPLSKGQPTRSLPMPKATQLVAPEAPPIKRIEEVKPVELITTPKGAKIIDFGQNLVGWVKIKVVPKNKSPRFPLAIVLRHAEVLDQGEIGMRPLRTAKATDKIFLGDKEVHNWEPEFTTHGFRYVEIAGCDVDKDNFIAVVVHSDMERLGDFECSHEYINKLHSNVLWGFKGNFVGVPTDCPQRDERLGWTGDLQVVVPTASFLFDTSGMLANWLHGLKEEQLKDGQGVPPLVSPAVLDMQSDPKPFPQAVWCDVCTMAPLDLYHAFGSPQILEEMWESMSTWIDKGIPKGKDGLWDNPPGAFQLADWLDPKAPPDDAAAAVTDPFLVANEYLVRVTAIVAEVAQLLGKDAEHKKYKDQADARLKAFQNQYATPLGRLAGDTQTAYVLAIAFDLLSVEQMKEAATRLAHLCQKDQFRIGTGFAGTNSVLKSLVKTDQLQLAYRMLQEGKCPSWFYPITMGATTIWERWDSLLPDGSINPGEMTSFNHYAFGSVANFLHSTIAGLSPAQPGWKVISIYPRPGGTVTSAKAHHITPYGKVASEWFIKDGKITLKAEVPPNTTAEVQIGKVKETVGSGYHEWTTKYEAEGEWPPISYTGTSPEARKQTFIP